MVLRRPARPEGRDGHGDQRGRGEALRAPRERCLRPRRQAAGRESAQGGVYSPTVVDRVAPDMELVREETFGPVSPVLRFKDIDEAIRMVNGTAYGLSSGICTNRIDYVTQFISQANVGSVNVWEVPGYRLESTPFGGVKDSGLGIKEGVIEAMKSFTNVKTYSIPW